jgi:hypothetical protein
MRKHAPRESAQAAGEARGACYRFASETGGTTMRALLLAALLAAPAAAMAAPAPDAQGVRAFLQSIYAHYRHGSYGAPLERPELFFEPVLARAVRHDQAESARTGDVGKLDGDPFCDCQDFDFLDVTIGPVAIVHGRAKASVHFRNGDEVTLNFTLVWTRAGWRVADIEWPEGGTLRETFGLG